MNSFWYSTRNCVERFTSTKSVYTLVRVRVRVRVRARVRARAAHLLDVLDLDLNPP